MTPWRTALAWGGGTRGGRWGLAVCGAAVLVSVTTIVLRFIFDGQPTQDEEAEVYRSLRYASGDFRPTFVAWGALPSYVLFLLFGVAYVAGRVLGSFSSTEDYLRLYLTDPGLFFLIGRAMYALVGGILLLAIARFTTRRYGPVAGAAAVMALAFLPLTTTFSTTVKCDGLAALFGALAVFASLPSADTEGGEGPGAKRALLSGSLLGAAVGVKYHLLLTLPGILLGLWQGDKGGRPRRLYLALSAMVLVFLLCNPFLVLSPEEWLLGDYGLFRMFGHMDPRKTAAYSRADLWGYFRGGVGGLIPALLLLASLPVAAVRGGVAERAVSLSAVSFLAILAAQPYAEPHHLLPCLPLLSVLFGRAVADSAERWTKGPWIPVVLLALFLLLPLGNAVATIRGSALPNTLSDCRRWTEANLPSGSRVLVDWAYVPTLHRDPADIRAELEDGRPDSPARVAFLRRVLRLDLKPAYRLGVLAARLRESQDPAEAAHFDIDRYRRDGFEFALISDAWYGRFFGKVQLPEDQPVRDFYTALLRDFPVLVRFEPEEGVRVGPSIRMIDLRR